MTYTLIAHTELGSAQANITFSSIPATFTDLYLVTSLRNSTANTPSGGRAFRLDFNNYATLATSAALQGQGSGTPTSFTLNFFTQTSTDDTSGTFGSGSIYIPNYRVSAPKSISIDSVGENNATASEQQITAQLWSVNDAITSIRISAPFAGGVAQFSSATLYGITAGSSGGVVVS
jgi:hypothetical protein